MAFGPSGGQTSEPGVESAAAATSTTTDRPRKRYWRMATMLRLAFAVALTAITFWMSEPRAVLAATRNALVLPLLAVVALVAIDRAITAQRWLVLLRPFIDRGAVSVGVVLRVFFVSSFLGTFLPAVVGADSVRVLALSRYEIRGSDVLASVLVDRLLGVLAIVLAAALGLVLSATFRSEPSVLAAVGLMSTGCVVAGAFVFSGRLQNRIRRLSLRLPLPRWRLLAERLTTALQAYARRTPALAQVVILSLGLQVLRVLQAYGIGISLGMTAPLGAYFAIVPLVLLVMLLPISISGLGTTQLAFVWFFGQVGVGAPQAFALSVLFLALGVIGNLPGAFMYTRWGLPAGQSDPPTERLAPPPAA